MRKWLKSNSTLNEDGASAAIANVTGDSSSASMSMPADAKRGPVLKRYKKFKVPPSTFEKVKPGLAEWRSVLDKENLLENEIVQFSRSNPDCAVVLENVDTKALRAAFPYDEMGDTKTQQSIEPEQPAPEVPLEIKPQILETPSVPSLPEITHCRPSSIPKKWTFTLHRSLDGKLSQIVAESIE